VRSADYDIFARNIAIAGGLLILVGTGPGPFAVDNTGGGGGGARRNKHPAMYVRLMSMYCVAKKIILSRMQHLSTCWVDLVQVG
jgi:hypothetical protein